MLGSVQRIAIGDRKDASGPEKRKADRGADEVTQADTSRGGVHHTWLNLIGSAYGI
jgi:hypothetical protein